MSDTNLISGYAAWRDGDFDAAERYLRLAVAEAPGGGEPCAALADYLEERGRLADAVAAWRAAVEGAPERHDWRVRFAMALARSGEAAEAQALLEAILADRPDAIAPRRALADLMEGRGIHEVAIAHYREILHLDPADRDAGAALADILLGLERFGEAAELLQPLVRRYPDHPGLLERSGRAWMALGEWDRAEAALTRGRDLTDAGDDGVFGRLIDEVAARRRGDLPRGYLRTLFDQYADHFDDELTSVLGYRGPAVLQAAIRRVREPRPGALRVLDLGCGTGLAGEMLRPWAVHLEGVDLSPRMIERAEARGLYDALSVGDLEGALVARAAAWDLLVAADVLVYLGDLTPVFAAAASALAPGGLFAATVERLDDGAGWRLGATRRFAHSEAHVRDAAGSAGLAVRLMEPGTTRRERRMPVPGLVFVLERPAA